MGKYTASCLKIITCGAADTRENEDLAASETKAPSHKRRCGFRKKSVGHRVQNDIVISDPVSAACNKEREVVTTKHFNSDAHSATPEKTQEGDKPKDTFPLSSTIATSEADHTQFADTNTLVIDGNIQESVAVVIQSTIRAYMAQRELLNLKNIVKLQAVVRGHLLRKQAVGTLCCVQAIVKMQALVRVHLAHQSIAKDKQQMYSESSDLLGKGNLRTKTNKKRPPVQILLSNRFAQQLLESTAKTKAMHIRCDPSRTDSTWKWLERWTVITSSDVQGLSVCEDYNGILNDAKSAASGISEESPAADAPVISSSNSINQLEKPEYGKENMRSESSDTSGSFKLDNSTSAPCNILSSSEKVEQDGPQLEDQTSEITLPVHTKTEDIMQEPFHPLSTQKLFQSDAISQSLPESASYETEVENKNSLGMDEDILNAPGKSDEVLAEDLSTKPEVSEEGLESNSSAGFETEHSASVTYKSLNSAVKVEQDNLQLEDQNLRTMQPRHTKSENIMQGASGSLSVEQALLSDGTESEGESPQKLKKRETPEGEEKMSALGSRRLANPAFVAAQSKFEQLSSTQNVGMFIEITNQASGDQSKLGDAQSQVNPLLGATDDPLLENSFSYGAIIQKASSEYRTELYMSSALDLLNDAQGGEIMDEAGTSGKGNCAASADNALPGANLNAAVNGLSSDLGVLQPQMNGEDNRRSKADLLVATDPVTEEKRQKEPTTNSDVQNHLENPTDEQGYRPSQEGSPLNHATLLKFNGTSGIAIKRRRDTIATQKLRSHTLWKGLPYTPNGDSSGKNSTSRLPERIKIGMRRSSFGAANSDCVDCEPRISSSQSLPNYMQFTESARAKTHGSISPKSSSDVHDKYYSKKRHSLPIANEKQGGLSPRLRRSKSQAQQNINGYGTHSPQSYAERRWQI